MVCFMKIKSLCDVYVAYQQLFDFWIDTGLVARPDLGPDITVDYFMLSYGSLNGTISMWKSVPGSEMLFKCSQ